MTTQPPLIPRQPKRMIQPRKDEIRRQLEVAQALAAFDSTPRWWRLWHRVWARLVELDPHAKRSMAPPHRNPCPPASTDTETLPGIEP